jgi:hypothetical protein
MPVLGKKTLRVSRTACKVLTTFAIRGCFS